MKFFNFKIYTLASFALFYASTLLSSDLIETRYGIDNLKRVSAHPVWHKLLHYNRFFPWSGISGEVDGDGFYFSPRGRHNPLDELEATLQAFEDNEKVGKIQQPALCAFPERFRFLKKELALTLAPPPPGACLEYEHFLKQMNSKGVALIFSSAYASNPGSMFGHTLLKFTKETNSDLLDEGVSFAATIQENEGGLFYLIFGLLGGYAGNFSFQPYYQKVNEYINSESRDLWEYRLNLTPGETLSVINSLWELESNSWFDYYFINKNCSYQLLTVLEIVKPEWDLSSGWTFVVPAETIKRILEIPGAVTERRFRPSLKRKLSRSVDLLSSDDREIFKKLVDRKMDVSSIQSPRVLSAAIQYVQYIRAEKGGAFTDGADASVTVQNLKKVIQNNAALSQNCILTI